MLTTETEKKDIMPDEEFVIDGMKVSMRECILFMYRDLREIKKKLNENSVDSTQFEGLLEKKFETFSVQLQELKTNQEIQKALSEQREKSSVRMISWIGVGAALLQVLGGIFVYFLTKH